MGFSIKKAVKKAASSVSKTVKDAGKTVSKAGTEAIKFGATAPFEYGVLKPIEAVAPKVLSFAGRARAVAGTATETLQTVKATVAENQELASFVPGLGGLFQQAGTSTDAGYASSGYANESSGSIPTWAIVAGVVVLGGFAAYLALRK